MAMVVKVVVMAKAQIGLDNKGKYEGTNRDWTTIFCLNWECSGSGGFIRGTSDVASLDYGAVDFT